MSTQTTTSPLPSHTRLFTVTALVMLAAAVIALCLINGAADSDRLLTGFRQAHTADVPTQPGQS